jgi:predicted dehydrogenase
MNWMMGSTPISCFGMGGRAVRTGPEFGNIYDHFTVEYQYPNGIRNLAMSAQMAGTTNRVYNRIEGTEGWGMVNRATSHIEGHNPYEYDGEPKSAEEALFAALIKGIRDGKPMNDGRIVAEATMTAIMGRTSAYTGRELKWDWVMKASKLDLRPKKYEIGPLPVEPVALPGITQLV